MLSWQGVADGRNSFVGSEIIRGKHRKCDCEARQKLSRKAWRVCRSLEEPVAFYFILNFLSVSHYYREWE